MIVRPSVRVQIVAILPLVKAGVLLCVVAGHKWHVDESTETNAEVVLACGRCGRRQLAPTGSAFGNRVNVKAGADRSVGPFGGRR